MLRRVEIEIGYWVRIARIQTKLYQRLTRITISGWALRIALWISPELKKELGLR